MIDYKAPDFSDSPGRRANPHRFVKDGNHDLVDVSIITPFFNAGDYFEETALSIQAQTLQNWEWVIVDDGSADVVSIRRLSKAASGDSRIKVIRQSNAGPSAARNASFRNTSGRYVCLLDSDDLIEPTYLEKCVWFLESHPEFAFCNSHSVVFGETQDLWRTGFEVGKKLLQANSGPPISVIRRRAFEDCGGFDESIRVGHEDWDFWLAMAKAGHWGATIPEFQQWYRKRSDGRFEQIMRSENVNKEFEASMQAKYECLRSCFPEPVPREQLPYETIPTDCSVCNPLASNRAGRRVLFLVPWMVTGGADRANLGLLEGLTAKGHEVTVCATLTADQCWEHQFSRFTPDIFVLPNFLHFRDFPRFLTYLIRSRRIDTVLITGSTVGYHLLPYLRAVSPEVTFLDLCHVEEPHWLNGGHPRFAVGYQDLLDLNIVTSKHLAAWMEARGADAERIRVMYTGVRLPRMNPPADVRRCVRLEFNIPDDLPVIIFAGRICEQKRPMMLAEILNAARDQGLMFWALIIGEGELRPQLKSLLCKYHLNDRVRMMDFVSPERLLDILTASDVLLMPSRYEGISLLLQESMAVGTVPVVARVGGQDEIVPSDAGVLIEPREGEVADYVDAIRRVLADRDTLNRMSERCKAVAASELSWEKMIDNFMAIMDDAEQIKVRSPRNPISPGFGREMATLALEYKRLDECGHRFWSSDANPVLRKSRLPIPSSWARVFAKYAIMLSQTPFGRAALRNHFVKMCSKWLLMRISGVC